MPGDASDGFTIRGSQDHGPVSLVRKLARIQNGLAQLVDAPRGAGITQVRTEIAAAALEHVALGATALAFEDSLARGRVARDRNADGRRIQASHKRGQFGDLLVGQSEGRHGRTRYTVSDKPR